jgi:hypothetical protein
MKKNFERMCELEPRLKALLQEAQMEKHRRNPNFCRNELWYAVPREYGYVGLKFLLQQFVDSFSSHEELRDFAAYDVAYHTIHDALPPCNHEGGCRWDFALPNWPNSSRREQSTTFADVTAMLHAKAGE